MLRHIDSEIPAQFYVHLILDNYGTHKTEKEKAWLFRHPRIHCHFTPTYSSWINLVERFFATLTKLQLRRGTNRPVPDFEKAVRDYREIHIEEPKPLRWPKTSDEIIKSANSIVKRINRTVH